MRQKNKSVSWKTKKCNSPRQTNKIKYKEIKIIFLNEDVLRDLFDNIKWNNIHIIGVPEERDKKPENYLKK